MDAFDSALRLIPARYLDECRRGIYREAEEFRMRVGRKMTALCAGREWELSGEALREEELLRTLEKATGASLHSAAAEMARGFISYRGLRIGLCGSAVEKRDGMCGFRSFSSLSIRIPHEAKGSCDSVFRKLNALPFENMLILSPPGGGKTTALRELIRLFSDGGRRVGVLDERGEIAAMDGAFPGFDLGAHTDVLSFFPKREGAMLLLRGMNEQMIAMDEITQPEDLAMIREIIGCGVGLLATAHADRAEELRRRPLYAAMLDERLFAYAVEIRREGSMRRYEWKRLET